MNPLLRASLSLLIPTVVIIHLVFSPYTKVEESFNIQAIHDILIHGIPFKNVGKQLAANYDHVEFPGSVPRTFVGAFALAEISRPWARWLTNPVQLQLLVRGVLGVGNALVLLFFQDAVNQAFGNVAGYWYILLQASQFHVIYYASRTLPNMFAFGFTNMALQYIVMANFGPQIRRVKRVRHAIYYMTLAGVIFRSEIAILLSVETGYLIFARHYSARRVIIPAGLTAAAIGLLITVGVDSFFWQKFPLWPEWIAFRYNAIGGKATNWGTSPWHFYFTNALPRLMLNPMAWLVCIPIALWQRSTRNFSTAFLAPLLGFVGIYSILPHKEWRFIIYVIPGMTAVASAGASWVWQRRTKSLLNRILCLALVTSTLASFTTSLGLLAISSLNYPGAEALQRLHQLADGTQNIIIVHLDNLSCQTGVTRFLEVHKSVSRFGSSSNTTWIYDKTESIEDHLDPLFWQRFDYVLAEHPELVIGAWDILDVVDGFARITLSRTVAHDDLHFEPQKHSVSGPSFVSILNAKWMPLERSIRTMVTRGWWLTVRMEPKIRIMKKQLVVGLP